MYNEGNITDHIYLIHCIAFYHSNADTLSFWLLVSRET